MAKVTIGPNGLKAGVAGPGNPNPSKRGLITGWSAGAARRNRDFLQSIDLAALTGVGMFYTFTVRDLPATSKEWTRIVGAMLDWLNRHGCVRYHWVVEFQRRGVPHLHLMAYWPSCYGVTSDPADQRWMEPWGAVEHWLKLTGHLNSSPYSQRATQCDQRVELLTYMAKHSARTADHYQRSAHALPEGWQSVGRLWGKGGDWPTRTEKFDTNDIGWFLFRRLVRGWRKAEAAKKLAKAAHWDESGRVAARRAVTSARTCLRCTDGKAHSRVKPLVVWAPERATRQILGAVISGDPRAWIRRVPQVEEGSRVPATQ
jgi:hypothetical protein